jgi:hypothetical protein
MIRGVSLGHRMLARNPNSRNKPQGLNGSRARRP